MKKIIFPLYNLLTSTSASLVYRTYVTSLVFALITLSSCSKDDDEDFSADVTKLVGTYTVVDTDEDGEIKNYSIIISKSGGGVEISNFGKIMYVPVKASIKGNVFTIPSQTFNGKSMTIVISGRGTLNDDKLNFDYTIDTDDGYELEHVCVANKNS